MQVTSLRSNASNAAAASNRNTCPRHLLPCHVPRSASYSRIIPHTLFQYFIPAASRSEARARVASCSAAAGVDANVR